MEHHYFNDGYRISGEGTCGENKETDSRRPVLAHVIILLQSLIGILDIISDNIGKNR